MSEPTHRHDLEQNIRNLPGSLELTLCPPSGESEVWQKLKTLAARLGELAPAGSVTITEQDLPDLPARPALVFGGGEQRNIRYLGLPLGPEEPPFVEAVIGAARGRIEPEPAWASELSRLADPVQLTVFMAPACPHCPHAVRAALQLALSSPLVETTVVDAQEFTGLAARFQVKSVPLTVIDGGLSLTGVVPAAKLVDRLLSRGEPDYQRELFDSLVEVGRHEDAARVLVRQKVPRLFLDRWRDSTLAERIGLMLVAEEALDHDPSAFDPVLDELLVLLGSEDGAIRGDTADLLGRMGNPKALDGLAQLLDDPNPDVADIAQEAIEEISSVKA